MEEYRPVKEKEGRLLIKACAVGHTAKFGSIELDTEKSTMTETIYAEIEFASKLQLATTIDTLGILLENWRATDEEIDKCIKGTP